jgi:hypothetical protein
MTYATYYILRLRPCRRPPCLHAGNCCMVGCGTAEQGPCGLFPRAGMMTQSGEQVPSSQSSRSGMLWAAGWAGWAVWLAGWLGWLPGWLGAGWLAGWLAGWVLAGWLAGWLLAAGCCLSLEKNGFGKFSWDHLEKAGFQSLLAGKLASPWERLF